MVFRKGGRPKGPYYTWPTLTGFGKVGPYSTGVRTKALAESVERWLRDAALSDPAAVRGIVEGHYSLREAYQASKEHRLQALVEQSRDPLLVEVIERYRAIATDRRVLDGLEALERAVPSAARLSWLTAPKHITDLLSAAVAGGQKVNSVHRSLYAAVKGVLSYELGKARKRAITADVVFRYQDDTRRVEVTPEELRALLDACDEEMRDLVTAAVLTGVDRGPLLALTPAHVDLSAGLVRIPDTKNDARQRAVPLSHAALVLFRRLIAGRGEREPLFRLTPGAVSNRWSAVQRATGLDVRFKDLRHVFSNAWVDEGGTLAQLGDVLGHKKASTTLRYTARQARADRARVDRVAERLGLVRDHLRVEKGA